MKFKIFAFVFVIAFGFNHLMAQDFDSKPAINIENKSEDLKFTIGARFMADVAYYGTENGVSLNSGAAISDARIRTSMTYQKWYFYADFDFSRGKFAQKNIFLQYSMAGKLGTHAFKAGYYNNPATMANNTSRGSLHFIARAAPVNFLAPGRELGVSYIFYNKHVLVNQGVFAENKYNDQISGFQGVTIGGRWVWKPINENGQTFHVGATFRRAELRTGVKYDDVLQTEQILGSSLETYVDPNQEYLRAEMPWAKYDYYTSGEMLYIRNKFFARGEYLYRYIKKERDDAKLFESQLGQDGALSTLEQWRKANPLSSDKFDGAYVEAGYKILGGNYVYSDADGVVKGSSVRTLEAVGRYSYLSLQDKKMHSFSVGANYAFNKYAQLLLSYSYTKIGKDVVNTVQTRLMFQF